MVSTCYSVYLAVEPVDLDATYTDLPLHCTILPWFTLGRGYESGLRKKVAVIARRTTPIELISVAPALFGPNNDTPVHTVKRVQQLVRIHNELKDRYGAHVFDTHWTGKGYRPHVTTIDDRAFLPGTTHMADTIYAVRIVRYSERTFRKTVIERQRLAGATSV